MAPSFMLALTLAHLLIAFACGQMNNTSPKSCPVTKTHQLTVNGCPVFVHDVTGAKDFVIEPLMCITEKISNVLPQFDPVTQQMFVSVPVTVTDESMIVEIGNQLQNLSPKSIDFATVSDISVSIDASSKYVMFLWSPDEPVGYLRLGCFKDSANCISFFLRLNESVFDAINGVIATAKVAVGSTQTELKYKLTLQNQTFIYPQFYGSKFECRSNCDNVQFLKSVTYGKCIARVYQRQDINEIFYVEPLLCPQNSGISELIMYDYSRDMHYLKLDVVLQNDTTMNAVHRELENLSPTNVSYMQLWRVEISVSSLLRSRFDIGRFMVSGDWRSGQLQVYCKTEDDCNRMRSSPLSFWSHVKFQLKSHTPSQCVVKSNGFFYNMRLIKAYDIGLIKSSVNEDILAILCFNCPRKYVENKLYVIIQQRTSNAVSFDRTWNEYEDGFGDGSNFWIGLSKIHSLSSNGVTLRVETKLDSGTEYYREYAGFKVGDASTNYTITLRGLITGRSNGAEGEADWQYYNGMQFSTKDRDNDLRMYSSCSVYSEEGANSGWWFKNCAYDNPNHGTFRHRYMAYVGGNYVGAITKELRLMLQI